jgi:hypothetical protein
MTTKNNQSQSGKSTGHGFDAGAPMPVAALGYAKLGLKIIPLDGKIPVIKGGRGHHDASSDPAQIKAWWTKHPCANIGMPMQINGLLALDIDPRNGGDVSLGRITNEHGPLPDTWKQRTGGGGWHYVFRSDGRSYGSPGPGVDIKNNGYIVVAPSIHPVTNEFYEWETPLDPDLLAAPPSWLNGARTRRRRNSALIGLRDDPIFDALLRLERVHLDSRGEPNIRFADNGTEKVNIICPWVSEHTDKIDDGAAYFAGGGFKCHHAHCDHRRGRDLEDWLRKQGEDISWLKQERRCAIDTAKMLAISNLYRALADDPSIVWPRARR